MSMRLSQDDLARAIRAAGARAGVPNDASKRLIQRWEAGVVVAPRPVYARALEMVTGLPLASLGFSIPLPDDPRGEEQPAHPATGARPRSQTDAPRIPNGAAYTGVWLSTYHYPSSSRGGDFRSRHYVVIIQHGDRLTVRSLPNSASGQLSMDLTVDGNVLTGTWVEQTDPDGYYRGARYHGAIQLLAEPTGRRLAGKWVGFGRDLEVNTGTWEVVFQEASTTKSTIDKYDRRPEDVDI